MRLGHIAVVSRILGRREILIRHANWSQPGAIEEDVLAQDVSEAGDWSQVRVWHYLTGQMGARSNSVDGFIYSRRARLAPFKPELEAPERRFTRLSLDPGTTSRLGQLSFLSGWPRRNRLSVDKDVFHTTAAGEPLSLAGRPVQTGRTLADIARDIKLAMRMRD